MIAATLVLYGLIMLLVGIIAYRRTANLSDYILGGRKLNSFVTALSAEASDMSGWLLLLGLPGYAYAAGCEAVWLAVGLLIGTYCNWRFIAARLRDYTFKMGDSLTLSKFLEARFHDRSGILRLISGLFILLFFMFYTTSGLVAGGKLFASVFGLVAYAWAGFGAAFGPTIIMSLFWDQMTRNGALAGIITGGLTVICWKQLQGGIFDLYEIVPGFIFSLLAIVIVSKTAPLKK